MHPMTRRAAEKEVLLAMTTSLNLVRWGAVGFVLGGVVWVVAGLIGAFMDLRLSPGLSYYYVVLVLVGRLLMGAGVVGLHTLQQGSIGRNGRVGFYAVLVGIALQVLGDVILLAGSPAAAYWVSLVGFLVLVVGFVLYGATSLQAGVLPRWYAVLLIVFVPISWILGSAYGVIWAGAILLVLGFVLWARSEEPEEQAPRVR